MKLTQRTLSTGLTPTDLIHIVKPNDLTQSPQGSSYKSTVQQFLNVVGDVMFEPGSSPNSLKDKRSAVSSGNSGQVIGFASENTGDEGQSIGWASSNSGYGGQSIGFISANGGQQGQSIGGNCTNLGIAGQAIGQLAYNRIERSTNISGPIFIRKSESNTTNFSPPITTLLPYQLLSGSEVIIISNTFNANTLTGETISFPTNVKMFVDEVGFIATSANTVTVQPSISYGVSGNTDLLLTGTSTTGISSNGDRDRQITLLTSNGVTSLSFEVTSTATATTLVGRCYFKGFIVENQ
jgi:hypothetical protein